jgi:hypothetical protein
MNREICPECDSPLRHGRKRMGGGYIMRRRDCDNCGYADQARYEPEVLLCTFEVKRRNKVRPRTLVDESQQNKTSDALDVA